MIDKIKSIMQEAAAKNVEEKRELLTKFAFTMEDFTQCMTDCANCYLTEIGRKPIYSPELSALQIEQYYSWITGSDESGITIWGDVGTGKTVTMNAFYKLYKSLLSNYRDNCKSLGTLPPQYMTAPEIQKQIIDKNEFPMLGKYVVFVDDIGKDDKKKKDYGNDIMPLAAWIFERDKYFVPVFGTSNLSPDRLIEMYGVANFDRLRAMSKFIEIKGKSKR